METHYVECYMAREYNLYAMRLVSVFRQCGQICFSAKLEILHSFHDAYDSGGRNEFSKFTRNVLAEIENDRPYIKS